MAEEIDHRVGVVDVGRVVPDVHDGALGRERPQHEGVLGVATR